MPHLRRGHASHARSVQDGDPSAGPSGARGTPSQFPMPATNRRVIRPPAIAAGPVPRRKRHRLIKEKQRGPIAPRHDLALAFLPIQHATNPRLMGPTGRAQNTPLTVHNPAIARQRTAACIGHDFSCRQDAVLERHGINFQEAGQIYPYEGPLPAMRVSGPNGRR